MKPCTILIAEGDEGLRREVRAVLRLPGYTLLEAFGVSGILPMLGQGRLDLVIVGPRPDPHREPLAVVQNIRRVDSRVPVILLTEQSSEGRVVAALRAGVVDYFKPPFSFAEIGASVRRLLQAEAGRSVLPARAGEDGRVVQPIVGESAAMRELRAYLDRVAATESNVLITGETGTGKELAAFHIHWRSARRDKPLVSINCAAIPETLLESELFGYERGAFTGAHAQKEGQLKSADGGTVFLDEVGDMSLASQAKILRAIDSREVSRLGGRAPVSLNVRVIAATNQDLESRVAEGQFRPDLYYRLNVARVHLPPLRDRCEDIPTLCDHYIRELNRRFGRSVEGLSPEAVACLLQYPWPGNVRELRNLLEAAFITVATGRIALADLPEPFRRHVAESEGLSGDERTQLLNALFATNWNKSQAAQRLHWSRMTLYRKLAKYSLSESRLPPAQQRPGPGRERK